MMHQIKRSSFSMRNKWFGLMKSAHKGLEHRPLNCLSEVGSAGFSSLVEKRSVIGDFSKRAVRQLSSSVTYNSPFQIATSSKGNLRNPCSVRCFASQPTSSGQKQSQTRKEVSTFEDPFDAPTYNIPEKPVTFTEGASYSLVILAGLGIAGAAAYGVFKELIFQPKEYKIFNKALERIQNDGQVKARIGSPVTGYGSESRNRAARQRIPHKTWTDEDGVEHIVVNFHIRGPHGAGKVFSEMFKDKTDNEWKFMYLIVELTSPSPAQLMLESYVPA